VSAVEDELTCTPIPTTTMKFMVHLAKCLLAASWLLAMLVSSADLLFVVGYDRYAATQALAALYTIDTVTTAVFETMTTAQFSTYRAIIIADNTGTLGAQMFAFLDRSKARWSPAIRGNIVMIGSSVF